jgi:hypothetical protein
MSWVVTGIGVTVGTTALGAVQANQNRKAQQKANQQQADISAAQTQYSPWTGIKGGTPDIKATPDNTAGIIGQGALSGVMFGEKMSRKGIGEDPDFADENFKADAPAAAPISPTTSPIPQQAPASTYVPVMDEMQREEELSRTARGMYLPNKPRFR